MCGIVGAVIQSNQIVSLLITGLTKLEYRGYDSAGIAIINNKNDINAIKALGKLDVLTKKVENLHLEGHIGIAHTRWATHGEPTEKNAHPHVINDRIALVHNGIIENYETLRDHLKKLGCQINSDTDSELIAHLIYLRVTQGENLLTAVQKIQEELVGTYAIAVIDKESPNEIIAARKDSPLIIGLCEDGNLLASDINAINSKTNKIIILEDGDIACLKMDDVSIYDASQQLVKRKIHLIDNKYKAQTKEGYSHYLLKEIYAQPNVIASLIEKSFKHGKLADNVFWQPANKIVSNIKHVHIVACGTSYYAGLVGKIWIEEIANIPCQIDIASEFRYKKLLVQPDTLFITLSQSGETADTLAALKRAKKSGYAATLSICNTENSSLTRESDFVFLTQAGPEISVASTKSFTTQLLALLLLSFKLNKQEDIDKNLLDQLFQLPEAISTILDLQDDIKKLASQVVDKTHVILISRGIDYPVALEGALKLKEVTYIHADAYPAGELKHGPLALIDSQKYVLTLAPNNKIFHKLKSNLEEIISRKGKVVVFTDKEISKEETSKCQTIIMPSIHEYLTPFIYIIPLQLLAFETALLKGTDIDQPRNLAKSVTVE